MPSQAQAPSPAANDAQTWAGFLALALIWGSSFLFIKIGLDEGVAPLTMVSLRTLLGGAFLGAVMWLRGGRLPWSRDVWARLTLLGLTNIVVPFALISWGQQYIPTGMGGILNAMVPLFAIVLASLVLHDESITMNRLGGLLIGFGGVILLALPNLSLAGDDADAALAVVGMVAFAVASLFYAIGAVYARHRLTGRPLIRTREGTMRALSSLEISFGHIVTAFIVVTALAVIFERPDGGVFALPHGFDAWFSMIWLGVLGTGLAYVLFFGILARWGATRTTLVTYVIPLVAIALGFAFLDERLRFTELAGAALIIGGVALANAPIGQRVLFGRSD